MSWNRYLKEKIPRVLASLCVAVTLGAPLQAQNTVIMNPFSGLSSF